MGSNHSIPYLTKDTIAHTTPVHTHEPYDVLMPHDHVSSLNTPVHTHEPYDVLMPHDHVSSLNTSNEVWYII